MTTTFRLFPGKKINFYVKMIRFEEEIEGLAVAVISLSKRFETKQLV